MTSIKVSACSANYGRLDLFEIIDRIDELGLDGVEITVMYHTVPKWTPRQRRKEIRNYIREKGLEISALHFIFPDGMRMSDSKKEERERIADHMVAVLELAADVESPTVVVGGGSVRSLPDDMAAEDAITNVLGVYEAALCRGEKLGVVAAFEALNRYETNFGLTLGECCGYVEQIGSPALKVAGDTFHMNIEESSLSAAITEAGTRLVHLHLPDSHRLAPGGGHINFEEVFAALHGIGYAGYVSFEFFSIAPQLWHLPTFEACNNEVAKGIDYLRRSGLVS